MERERERERETERERDRERQREREIEPELEEPHCVSVCGEQEGEIQARTHTHLINTHMERESETGFQHYS